MHKLNLMRPSYSSNTLSLNTTFLPFSHDYKMTSASPEVEKLNCSSPDESMLTLIQSNTNKGKI